MEKAGFQIERQRKHVTLIKGGVTVIVPRNDPIDAYTMASIVKAAGLTIEEFRRLLFMVIKALASFRHLQGRETLANPAYRKRVPA